MKIFEISWLLFENTRILMKIVEKNTKKLKKDSKTIIKCLVSAVKDEQYGGIDQEIRIEKTDWITKHQDNFY